MPELHELQEARALAVSRSSINDTAEREQRDYNADEDTKHKALKAEVTGLDRQIERARPCRRRRAAPASCTPADLATASMNSVQ